MILDKLNTGDMALIVDWRNKNMAGLRTSHLLTYEMQEDFYRNVICDPMAKSQYWAIRAREEVLYDEMKSGQYVEGMFIGMGGIENIEWENRLGEISLIIDPMKTRKGYGTQAVILILSEAFDNMNLENIYGECYHCNSAVLFWDMIAKKYHAETAILPHRKYWQGIYYNSIYFNFNKEALYEAVRTMPDGVK